MRHQKRIHKLSLRSDHRKALLRNLATSMALEGKIKTTSAKAKAFIPYMEHLIVMLRKKDSVGAIREVKRHLFTEKAQKAFLKRIEGFQVSSGFLRASKIGIRPGDAAELSLIEFVS